jgi:hypothetical protein
MAALSSFSIIYDDFPDIIDQVKNISFHKS